MTEEREHHQSPPYQGTSCGCLHLDRQTRHNYEETETTPPCSLADAAAPCLSRSRPWQPRTTKGCGGSRLLVVVRQMTWASSPVGCRNPAPCYEGEEEARVAEAFFASCCARPVVSCSSVFPRQTQTASETYDHHRHKNRFLTNIPLNFNIKLLQSKSFLRFTYT